MSHLWTRLILPEKSQFLFLLMKCFGKPGSLVLLTKYSQFSQLSVKSIKCWFFVNRQKFVFLVFLNFSDPNLPRHLGLVDWKLNSSIRFVYFSDVIYQQIDQNLFSRQIIKNLTRFLWENRISVWTTKKKLRKSSGVNNNGKKFTEFWIRRILMTWRP